MFLGWALGRLSIAKTLAAMKETATQTSMIFTIAIGGWLFVYFVALTGLSAFLTGWITDSGVSFFWVMVFLVIMYLLLGMFLDPIGIILLTLPVTLPIMDSFGMSLIWFGVVVVKLLEMGLVTPPIGINVFVIKSIVEDKVPLETIFRGIAVFLLSDIVIVALLIGFPALSLVLPDLLG